MIRPLGDHVCIKPEVASNKTKSGLILGPNDIQIPYEGVVIAIGKHCQEIKEGDRVAYNKFVGCEINIRGEVYRLAREKEIFAVI